MRIRNHAWLGVSIIVYSCFMSCGQSRAPKVNIRKTQSTMAKIDTLFSTEDSTSARFYVYDSKGLRDPFEQHRDRRSVSGGERGLVARPSLRVGAIMTGVSTPSALVNNKLVREGDVIEGARVAKIQTSSVVFEFNGQTFTVAQD